MARSGRIREIRMPDPRRVINRLDGIDAGVADLQSLRQEDLFDDNRRIGVCRRRDRQPHQRQGQTEAQRQQFCHKMDFLVLSERPPGIRLLRPQACQPSDVTSARRRLAMSGPVSPRTVCHGVIQTDMRTFFKLRCGASRSGRHDRGGSRCQWISCASCLLSAFRGACVCGRLRHGVGWRKRR